MKTLIIHPKDSTTDFLSEIYSHKDWTVINTNTSKKVLKEQIKTHGHPINTPDFLIKSDLYINNYKINWIDGKNFYGSTVPFIKDKIKKQTRKYLNTWGSGSIIFSLGSNENLKYTKQ